MGDCVFDKTDILILISADSDLVPTIEYISEHYPLKKIKVFFPPCRKSNDIMDTMGQKVTLLENPVNKKKFRKTVMPHSVSKGATTVTIPADWIFVS